MTEYIANPRRAPRAQARCAALVHAPGGNWSTETEDIGPGGCQLVAPRAMARGLPLTLIFANRNVQESLQVEGKVAWAGSQPPWRVGVAFGDSSRLHAASWFAQLTAAYPGLGRFRRVPDRLPVDAMVYLTPPPTFLLDFTPDEVAVVCHVANGTSIDELRDRLAARWNASLRAFFSLMARGVVTLSKSSAANLSDWKPVMADLDAEFVLDGPRPPRPAPVAVRVAPVTASPAGRGNGLDPGAGPAAPLGPPPSGDPAPAAPGVWTAGTGWRGGARPRSREAQEAFDLGRTELAAGRGSSALAHLRRALQLAPGDPEIASAIGRAMAGK